MKILRIYLKDSDLWCDMPAGETIIDHWVRVLQEQKFIVGPAFWIPRESIAYMTMWEGPTPNNIMPFKPTTIPPGAA